MKDLKFKPLSLFIQPVNLDVLLQRLQLRGTDSPETIAKRLEKAEIELREYHQFDVAIINDDLQKAKLQVAAIVNYFLKYGH
jgi:guanylate kinase